MHKTVIDNKLSVYAPIILSKVQILRNLENYPFSVTCTQEKKDEIEAKVIDYLSSNYEDIKICDYKNLTPDVKLEYTEDSLFNDNSKKNGKIAVLKKQNIMLVLNNNDHINISLIDSGFDIENSYKNAEVLEKKLSENFNFAASTKYGYMTSQIKNCGLGIKFAVIIHLPGITLLKKQNDVFPKYAERGCDIKPLDQYKVEDNETGYFIISTRFNFGLSENELLSSFTSDIEELIKINHSYLIEYSLKNKDEFVDNIFRSYGTLKYARLIDIPEAVYHLSNLRMGLSLGEDLPVTLETLNKIFVLLQEDYINELVENQKKPGDAIIAGLIKSQLNTENNDVS